MTFVLVAVGVSLLVSIVVQLAPEVSLSPFAIAYGLLGLAATIVLCAALRGLAAAHGLPRSSDAWRRAMLLVAVIWGALWAISIVFRIAGAVAGDAVATQMSFDAAGGSPMAIVVILLVLAAFVPALFLLIADITMLNEIREPGPPQTGEVAG